MKNKAFWNRVITIMAGFAMVIVVMAAVFPIQNSNSTNIATPTITTAQENQTEDNTTENA